MIKRRRTGIMEEKKRHDDSDNEKKDDNSKGHTWLQRERKWCDDRKKTGIMTNIKKRHNDKEKEDRLFKKEKKIYDNRGKDRKDEDKHGFKDTDRYSMTTGRRTGMMTEIKKRQNDKEKEDRHLKKGKKRHGDRGKARMMIAVKDTNGYKENGECKKKRHVDRYQENA
jgi:hypothetical protein